MSFHRLMLVFFAAPLACAAAPLQCHVLAVPAVTAADRALAAGDLAGAEALYTAQLSSSAGAYAGLVHVQLERAETDAAMETARRAAAAQPGSAEAQALRGDVLLRMGQIPEANEAYSAAIALDPCSPAGHFGRGRVAELSGRHAVAATEFAASHPLAPGNVELTAAFLQTLPVAQRLAPLRAFLASQPLLLPSTREALGTELAVLTDHLDCTPEAFDAARLPLTQVLSTGRQVRSWGLTPAINEATLATPIELDTSVDGIVLSASDAAKVHVRPASTATASSDAPYLGMAGKIRVGTVAYRNCPVRVVPDSYLNHRNSLIGTNFFRDHLIHIDYVDQSVTLTPLPTPLSTARGGLTDQFMAPEEKGWTPVYVAGSDVLIPTLINKKGPFLMGLDTGSYRTILSPAVNSMQLNGVSDATLNLEGYSGPFIKVMRREGGYTDINFVYGEGGKSLKVTTPFKLAVFRFAGNEADDRSVVAFDIAPKSREDGINVAGFLGFYLLRAYTLDLNYRDALAHLVFDQNRRYETREAERNR